MREGLRRSDRPNRIFEAVIAAAREAGLIGRKRVRDSTALYDAVAAQDTVTLVRSALVGLLAIVEDELAAEMRSAFERDDEYRKPGKPTCDWDDAKAREPLARSARPSRRRAPRDCPRKGLEQTGDDVLRIARRVAEERVISTVDPEARHDHKTAARGFDGY